MRIVLWNLERAGGRSAIAAAQDATLDGLDADVTLLTEVGPDRLPETAATSMPRLGAPAERWSAITSRWPLGAVTTDTPTLALAVVDAPAGAIVAACSVLPWRAAANHWPDRPGADHAFASRVAVTLDEHVTAIRAALTEARTERLVWGGDFNQELVRPIGTGSTTGMALLRGAAGALGIDFATTAEPALQIGSPAIDHVAVPSSWRCSVVTETPLRDGARGRVPASDHALTTIEGGP